MICKPVLQTTVVTLLPSYSNDSAPYNCNKVEFRDTYNYRGIQIWTNIQDQMLL